MNAQNCEIMTQLLLQPYTSQRALAGAAACSLGAANHALRELTEDGWLDSRNMPTPKAREEAARCAPKRAIILAAGFGLRMVPINRELPKALLEVRGERLIERHIRHLQEAGIRDISVVVGFMKEHLEYLIDDFGVKLVVAPDYATKNNLHSLARVLPKLPNSYIIPCDIWCADNPFRSRELYSWYMVTDAADPASSVRVSRKLELLQIPEHTAGNAMVGISYLLPEDAAKLAARIRTMCGDPRHDDAFWEDALTVRKEKKAMLSLSARVVPAEKISEINTYEQLRSLDAHSGQLHSDAIDAICETLNAAPEEITDITVLKKGMTNRSFLFACKGNHYIMRIPGEGTDKLINRAQEAAVYQTVAPTGICDDILYISPKNGYKITRYWEGARVCDPDNAEDLKVCMEKLRQFHSLGLTVPHEFNIFAQIDFYESLWEGQPSAYRDYYETKEKVLSLKPYIDAHAEKRVLTHIDAVPDNFLFSPGPEGKEELHLIDWEYAGMQDPHVDIAMFCIYAMYDRDRIEQLIDLYFGEGCPHATRTKIYCYIAACGLLWSNWCEFKRNLGVDFGEYSLYQYRYAKDFYRVATEHMTAHR